MQDLSTQQTLGIIKPVALLDGHMGPIITRITKHGFTIRAMRLVQLTLGQAQRFYEVHREQPFFVELCSYMASSPVLPMVLEKQQAVEDFRKLIGATDPQKADPGTIRSDFGQSINQNAIHGSDHEATASREVAFFFSDLDMMNTLTDL